MTKYIELSEKLMNALDGDAGIDGWVDVISGTLEVYSTDTQIGTVVFKNRDKKIIEVCLDSREYVIPFDVDDEILNTEYTRFKNIIELLWIA